MSDLKEPDFNSMKSTTMISKDMLKQLWGEHEKIEKLERENKSLRQKIEELEAGGE